MLVDKICSLFKGDEEKIVIFDNKYSIKDLDKIRTGKKEDSTLEFLESDLDYICDCSTVPFFEDYRWTFKNKQTGQQVDVYVSHYPDTDTISFVDGQESVYYIKNKEDET